MPYGKDRYKSPAINNAPSHNGLAEIEVRLRSSAEIVAVDASVEPRRLIDRTSSPCHSPDDGMVCPIDLTADQIRQVLQAGIAR